MRTIKSGAKVTTFKVADATGSVTFAVWDDVGSMLEPGEIFSLRGGYTELHAGHLILYCGKRGKLERTGEFEMLFVEEPNMSSATWPS